MWSLSPDLKLGMGINAPFGLKTEYEPSWAGRIDAIESELKTININPTIAYTVNEMISIGAGLQIQHAEVTLTQDRQSAAALIGDLSGDDWGFGATLGILVEFSEATRFGLGYRSQIGHTLEGDFTAGGALVDTVTADLTTPDQVTAGVYHDINDQFAVMGEIGWTNWSTFDEIRVKFDGGGPDSRNARELGQCLVRRGRRDLEGFRKPRNSRWHRLRSESYSRRNANAAHSR